MLVSINYIHSRPIFLFANSLAHEKGASIALFSMDDIYDVVLVSKPDVLLLDESDLDNIHARRLFEDLISERISAGKTKIVILHNSDSTKKQINHSNIKYISDIAYLPYNEYHKPKSPTEYKYMLCHLNCIEFDQNKYLESIIYPNNKTIPVKLVNCPQVEHLQNLGVVDEPTMLDLIGGCFSYINIDNQYVYDAMLMGKPIINLVSNKYLALDSGSIDIENAMVTYDSSIIQKHKISNLINYII